MRPATPPMTRDDGTSTNPAAGVIPTRPAMAPDTMPTELGFPRILLASSHVSAPAAAAVLVTMRAFEARPSAAMALPALNPNHPNHNNAAPSRVIGILWGSIEFSPKPIRFPITSAMARAPNPELM
ncbi:MAG: hypothetical protein BWY45_01556 [Euryarchaeota archaeon ADurb.Bin294]|nr:MAG: hypothetical protein BWY45_01556 [Euryarchaeota archaeon ADurb.Bin294]